MSGLDGDRLAVADVVAGAAVPARDAPPGWHSGRRGLRWRVPLQYRLCDHTAVLRFDAGEVVQYLTGRSDRRRWHYPACRDQLQRAQRLARKRHPVIGRTRAVFGEDLQAAA